jgi:hypothetical protein
MWEAARSTVKREYRLFESYPTHIKIFIEGWNLVQFIWNNKPTVSLGLYSIPFKWCNLLISVHQFSWNSRFESLSFSWVQQVIIVKHYLASCSCLTCQVKFRDTFSNSLMPNWPLFPWHRKHAGQKPFWLTFGVKWWQFGHYLSNFLHSSWKSLRKFFFLRLSYPVLVYISLQIF